MWNDFRMEMTQMLTVQQMKQISFLYSPLMAAWEDHHCILIYKPWMDTETYNKYLKKLFQTETKNINSFFFFPLFKQKYWAWLNLQLCIHITSRVHNSSESLESHSVSQRVPAVPRRSRILSCSSIFGTHLIHKLI